MAPGQGRQFADRASAVLQMISDPQGRRDVDCLRDLKAIDETQQIQSRVGCHLTGLQE